METHDKEVRYDLYCRTCKHKDTPQADDPCDECLSTPMNDGSVKPVNYMEARKRRDNEKRYVRLHLLPGPYFEKTP